MQAAAQRRFHQGSAPQHFRRYNVSADTKAFEILQSSSRAPDASTLPSVEVRPASGRTCTHSSYHACPCARFLSGGVLGPALPSPSFPVPATWHVHALRGYVKDGACAHDSACERMRMRTENACSTRLIRSDGSVVSTYTCREDAACIRRSLRAVACANDSAGEQMRARTQNAHERALARSRRALVPPPVSKQNVCHGRHGT
jgi:hypothetical protein